MTIRDRIFARISELDITQKEFAKRTGIPETTVSDWKKKKTNPTAEKILIICKDHSGRCQYRRRATAGTV